MAVVATGDCYIVFVCCGGGGGGCVVYHLITFRFITSHSHLAGPVLAIAVSCDVKVFQY